MAGSKISDLNLLSGASITTSDEFAVVDVSANETKRTTVADLETTLALAFQSRDAGLTAMSGQDITANSILIGTGDNVVTSVAFDTNTFPARASTGPLTSKPITDFALALLTDATQGQMQTRLGIGSITTLANEGTDTTCFVPFAKNATGDQGLFTNAGLTFNSATALLSSTLLAVTTSLTTPKIIGGTTPTSTLTYQTTAGVGAAGADHVWLVGNNGGTEAMRLTNASNLTVAGTLSSTNSQTAAERFGASSSVTGVNATAVGNAAAAVTNATAIGQGSTASGNSSVAIGAGCTNSGNGIAIGTSASATANSTVVIGASASSSQSAGTAIGASATSGNSGVAIGANTSAAGIGATSIGQGASCGFNFSIALGNAATATATAQMVVGGNGTPISNSYIGNGVTNSAPAATVVNASGGSGTDIAGASLGLAGGKGTGNAAGGPIILQTSTAGSTGTTLQTLTTRMTIPSNGASFNLPVQSAPASPIDGDFWREDNTNTGVKIRINGVTKTITVS